MEFGADNLTKLHINGLVRVPSRQQFKKHKIDIRQAGLDNKTDGTQLRLGVACFCIIEQES